MDSIGNTLRLQGQRVQLGVDGKAVTLTTTGESFMALVAQAASIDPGSILGSDLREADAVEAAREDIPAWVLAADADSQIPATIDGVRVKLTKREDNVANPIVRFEIVKVL